MSQGKPSSDLEDRRTAADVQVQLLVGLIVADVLASPFSSPCQVAAVQNGRLSFDDYLARLRKVKASRADYFMPLTCSLSRCAAGDCARPAACRRSAAAEQGVGRCPGDAAGQDHADRGQHGRGKPRRPRYVTFDRAKSEASSTQRLSLCDPVLKHPDMCSIFKAGITSPGHSTQRISPTSIAVTIFLEILTLRRSGSHGRRWRCAVDVPAERAEQHRVTGR